MKTSRAIHGSEHSATITRAMTIFVLLIVLFGALGFAMSNHVGTGHRCPIATEECATLQEGTGMALLHISALRTMLQGLIPASVLILAGGFIAFTISSVISARERTAGPAFRTQQTIVERVLETIAVFRASQSLRRWLALRIAGMPRNAVWVYGSS